MADHDLESRLRDLLGAQGAGHHALDPDEIVRRAKRRRRPRQLALGAGSTLVAAGVLVLGISALPQLRGADDDAAMVATDSLGESNGSAESTRPVSPYATTTCEEPTSVFSESVALSVTSELSMAVDSVSGSVIITNTSSEPVSGSVVSVRITFTDGERMLWQASADVARTLALEPGASEIIVVSEPPIACELSRSASIPAGWVRVDLELPAGPAVMIQELE